MKRLAVVAILVLVLGICGTAALHAQEPARIALLIGNQAYADKVGPLKNPHNDVARVEAALQQLGFKVTVAKDASLREIDGAVRRYVDEVRRAGPDAISFFYYSGHGAANPENQINYLIPVDATSTNTTDLWYQSFEQSGIIDKLSREAPRATHFVVFDACRNELNVTGGLKKGLGDDKGFMPVNDVRGMLIAYATGEKRTAADNGKFAEILAEELPKPGVEAVEMFRRVQLRVQRTVKQEPWMSLRYLPQVYLAGVPAAETQAVKPPMTDTDDEAGREWTAVDKTSAAMLETFLRRHGGSRYAAYAQAQLEALKHTQTALAAPPAKPPVESLAKPVVGIFPPEAGAPKVRESFRDCPNCPEMVVVPAGSFMMGDESDQHEVTIKQPFAVGKFEVTFAEWDACVSSGGCKHKPETEYGRGRQPVLKVSWNDITTEYLPWLQKKTGKEYRLLSEAEWEYAARAGTTTAYSTGQSIAKKQAQFSEEGNGSAGMTITVGSFPANAFGLHDMHGNAQEWAADCWNDINKGGPADGSARTTGECRWRVVRGGSWYDGPEFLGSAFRTWTVVYGRGGCIGFRVARALPR